MKRDLTNGSIISSLLAFSGPMILGNLPFIGIVSE